MRKIPEKLYFKIGEACKHTNIQPYVLRYWETEFPSLSPTKSKSGQRVYTRRELDVILRIKQLLYEDGYTIAGAKKKLDGELGGGEAEDSATQSEPMAPEVNEEASAAGVSPVDTGSGATVQELREAIVDAVAEIEKILVLLK